MRCGGCTAGAGDGAGADSERKLLLKGSALAGAPVRMLGSCTQMARLCVYVNSIVPSAASPHIVRVPLLLNLFPRKNVACRIPSLCSGLSLARQRTADDCTVAAIPPVMEPTEAQIHMMDAHAQSSLLQIPWDVQGKISWNLSRPL